LLHELVAVVASIAILEIVGDQPEVVHAGVVNCDRQGRIAEIGDIELAGSQGRDHRRRAGEPGVPTKARLIHGRRPLESI
jgi:hypothetical protein